MTRPLAPADRARLEALFTRIGEARKDGDTALLERLALEAWDAIPEPNSSHGVKLHHRSAPPGRSGGFPLHLTAGRAGPPRRR
jgi:hypothetical protein